MRTAFTIWGIALLMSAATLTLARHDHSGAWIAYAFTPGISAPTIYLMTGDGHHQQKVSQRLNCAAAPQWSGQWIAFSNPCAGTQDLLRVRPGGGHLEAVSNVPSYTDNSRWSPDREQVAVVRGTSEIYIVNASGGERFIATDYYFPQWSPDGGWIYARPLTNDKSSLDRLNVQTGLVEAVLPPFTVFTNPSWSPDAGQMVIAMPTENGDELFTLNPDGDGLTQISADLPEPIILNPAWSPNGEWIAFLGGDSRRQHSLYRIRPDGNDLQQISDEWRSVENLQWSPDSQWLLFTADVAGESHIFRLRADGASQNELAWGYAPQYAPVSGSDWRPAGVIVAALVLIVLPLLRKIRR